MTTDRQFAEADIRAACATIDMDQSQHWADLLIAALLARKPGARTCEPAACQRYCGKDWDDNDVPSSAFIGLEEDVDIGYCSPECRDAGRPLKPARCAKAEGAVAPIEPSRPVAVINQCDGCRRGLPVKDGWIHRGADGPWDVIACTKDRYAAPPAPGKPDCKAGCGARYEYVDETSPALKTEPPFMPRFWKGERCFCTCECAVNVVAPPVAATGKPDEAPPGPGYKAGGFLMTEADRTYDGGALAEVRRGRDAWIEAERRASDKVRDLEARLADVVRQDAGHAEEAAGVLAECRDLRAQLATRDARIAELIKSREHAQAMYVRAVKDFVACDDERRAEKGRADDNESAWRERHAELIREGQQIKADKAAVLAERERCAVAVREEFAAPGLPGCPSYHQAFAELEPRLLARIRGAPAPTVER